MNDIFKTQAILNIISLGLVTMVMHPFRLTRMNI